MPYNLEYLWRAASCVVHLEPGIAEGSSSTDYTSCCGYAELFGVGEVD